jgi:hypothetical protein
MKKLLSFNSPESAPQSATQKALRDLYRAARHIPYHDPYAAARLARIADQAEYFLHEWPTDQWPTLSHPDWPMPAKDVLLAWLASAKKEADQYLPPARQPWTYTAWRQITTLLLAALVPFA